jgi:hypothetical protein
MRNSDREGISFGRASQLFLVRVWLRKTGKGGDQPEEERTCYGKIQQVVTGETYDFHSSSELIDMLLRMARGTVGMGPDSNS